MLRIFVPLRGPYKAGDLVSFHRKGKWFGPGRIVGTSGRANFWLVHGGIPIIVSESQIRPATRSEVLSKQLLELRPSRKRRREAFEEPMDDAPPFSEDLHVPAALRHLLCLNQLRLKSRNTV